MPHGGLALMFVVGVGLGICLYYMFADGQHSYRNEGGGYQSPPPEDHADPWATRQNENTTRRRKRRSSVSAEKSSCTICLAELTPSEQSIQLRPCKHEFHKTCIAKWREQGPLETRNTCPNCRNAIFGSSG